MAHGQLNNAFKKDSNHCQMDFQGKERSLRRIVQYKIRLVACGFQQVAKVDFNDTFAQIVHWNTSIRSCFACVMKLGHLTILC